MKKNNLNIIYISISEKGPSGGGKIIYNHSDIINRLGNGITSQVLHLKKKNYVSGPILLPEIHFKAVLAIPS